MTNRELMQQALDALEEIHPDNMTTIAEKSWSKAIEALRAVLAQPEPYAAQAAMVDQQTQGRMRVDPVTGDVGIGTVEWDASAPLVVHPHPAFQATQPQPSEAEVCCQDFEKCVRSCTPRGQWIAHVRCGCGDQIMPNDGAECGNCVTARNAVKPQPVAQVHVAEDYYPHVIWAEGINAACFDQEYLYITPPQREWQTLTDDEIRIAWGPYFSRGVDVARVIEALLKKKNS